MRWRIISLQAIMVVVLAGAAAFAYGMGTFTTTQIHDELAAQQVYFPGTDQIRAGGALDPAKFSQEIRDQAGNQVTDGNQARIYANDFVAAERAASEHPNGRPELRGASEADHHAQRSAGNAVQG